MHGVLENKMHWLEMSKHEGTLIKTNNGNQTDGSGGGTDDSSSTTDDRPTSDHKSANSDDKSATADEKSVGDDKSAKMINNNNIYNRSGINTEEGTNGMINNDIPKIVGKLGQLESPNYFKQNGSICHTIAREYGTSHGPIDVNNKQKSKTNHNIN